MIAGSRGRLLEDADHAMADEKVDVRLQDFEIREWQQDIGVIDGVIPDMQAFANSAPALDVLGK